MSKSSKLNLKIKTYLSKYIQVYLSKDASVVDRWTIAYADGAVYTMGDEASGAPGLTTYCCERKNFSPRKDEVLVGNDDLPLDLIEQIRQHEV
jgi:hypothetical protein